MDSTVLGSITVGMDTTMLDPGGGRKVAFPARPDPTRGTGAEGQGVPSAVKGSALALDHFF